MNSDLRNVIFGTLYLYTKKFETEKCQLFDHSSKIGFRFNSRDISQLGSNFFKSSHVFLEKENSIENWSQLQQHIFKNFSFAENLKKIFFNSANEITHF